ncbi:MAG: type II secretion system F family protein, partial [Planctomycetota bacterium]
QAVGEGSTFSAAVAVHGSCFPPKLPAMIAAAEATGDVPGTLARFCDRLRGELEMRAAIIGAMIYPVILVLASSIVMTALMLGVLPQFGRVFASMGRPIPALTQFLIDVGEFGRANWMFIFPAVILLLIGCFLLRRQSWVRSIAGRFLLYAPFVKDASRPLLAGRNFRSIASMVGGGVPLLQAVQLTSKTVTDPSWSQLLKRVESNLIDGATASAAMTHSDFLPSEATQMMAAAERTGRVAEVLEDIGRFYEEDGARRIKRLIVALEPAIILVMGVVVAGVVMSVMLPLLDVSTIQR